MQAEVQLGKKGLRDRCNRGFVNHVGLTPIAPVVIFFSILIIVGAAIAVYLGRISFIDDPS